MNQSADQAHSKYRSEIVKRLAIHELRQAIHMIHDCYAKELLDVSHVRHGDALVEVFLFEVTGSPHADRCFVWEDHFSETKVGARAVLQTVEVPTADQALVANDALTTG